MIKTIRILTKSDLLQNLLTLGLLTYAAIATYLLLKLSPHPTPLLIGIDSAGTRIISDQESPFLIQERENFLVQFLMNHYQYTHATIEAQLSSSGDLMSEALWTKKKEDYDQLIQKVKKDPLEQQVEIQELRKIDAHQFQADLSLLIKNKLKESRIQLRVRLTLKDHPRSDINPYPYEVESYDEEIF